MLPWCSRFGTSGWPIMITGRRLTRRGPQPTPRKRPGLYARRWRYCRGRPANKDSAMGRPASERAPALAAATKQRARLAAAQANLAELKAAKLRGELVEAAVVEAEWCGVLRMVRARMLAVPSRVGARLPHLSKHDVAEIDQEIRSALSEIGGG